MAAAARMTVDGRRARASISPRMDAAPDAARVAVTGAGGFIGAALCRRLREDGHPVLGLDMAEGARAAVEGAGATFRRGDVTDPRATAAALAGCSHVVHTAAIVAETGAMAEFVRVNVGGTRNVLDAAQAAGAARVLCLASVAVWGYEFRRDLPEDAPPHPCGNPYVDTKGAAERLALARGATVVRPGDVYGPGSVPWIIRPLEAMRSGTFRLPGRGDGLITPVYVDDLVDGIVRALFAPEAAGRAYTVWDGEAVPARDFFAFHARMLGRDAPARLPRPLAAAAASAAEAAARLRRRPPAISRAAITFISRRASYPNARAREELGWAPQVTLAEGMRRSEAWARAQGLLA